MINSYYDKINYPKMEKFIRFKLIDLIFKNIEVNYDHENISNMILRLLQIPNIAVHCTQTVIYWMFTFLITVFSILAYILYINLEIGGIMIILFCIFFLTYYYVLLKVKNKSADRDKEEKVLTTHFDDVLSNSLSVIACKKIKDEKEYLENKHNIYDKIHEDQLWYSYKGTYLFSFIEGIFKQLFNIIVCL